MPPRYAYWTIIAGGLPTAFRAAHQEDLLPTFKRLKEKHPDAEMKWFARGKLWDSQEASRPAFPQDRRPGDRPPRSDRPARPEGERRGPKWRPGGEHRDPRQPFKDAKKARNQEHRQQRWEHKQRGDRDTRPPKPAWGKPAGDREFDRRGKVPTGPASGPRPERDRRRPPAGNRPPWKKDFPPRGKPQGDRFDARGPRTFDKDSRPPRKEWGSKPPRKEWSAKPPRKEWGARPPREERAFKPREDRPFKPREKQGEERAFKPREERREERGGERPFKPR